MSIKLVLEFLVILGALGMGARAGGVGLGLWGAVGLLVLVVGFGIAPAAIPGEVLLIVLTVIMAASSDSMSPNRLSVTMTSNCLGQRTSCMPPASASMCSS